MSNEQPAIIVKNLYKSFRLPHEQHSGLKQFILNFFRRPSKRVRGYETQHVLNDISFEIKKGEFFGIVGRNGSGKSTLLKLLAGIYTPDKGAIQVNGSLTPFIELGVGFNPELTGRENVYLNGALLGFSREEMNGMYDDIVEFAELEKFMDQKLKNYSSGMQVRLAFSIAIRAKSDILVLDEVLAVGDAAFQQKCNDYFEKQKADKQTIVLVTHNMASVEEYCTKALLIEDGEIVLYGDPEKVAARYSLYNQQSVERQISSENTLANRSDVQVSLNDKRGKEITSVDINDEVYLSLAWSCEGIKNVGVSLNKQTGERIFATNTQVDGFIVNGNTCVYKLKLSVAPGKYYFRIRLYGKTDLETRVLIEDGPVIMVKESKKNRIHGLVYLSHEWVE